MEHVYKSFVISHGYVALSTPYDPLDFYLQWGHFILNFQIQEYI